MHLRATNNDGTVITLQRRLNDDTSSGSNFDVTYIVAAVIIVLGIPAVYFFYRFMQKRAEKKGPKKVKKKVKKSKSRQNSMGADLEAGGGMRKSWKRGDGLADEDVEEGRTSTAAD